MSVTFTQLIQNYPKEEKAILFRQKLGGGFVDLVDNENYNNTCAIRISMMLNRIGGNYAIPRQLGVGDGGHRDKDGKHILIKVKTAHDFVVTKFGQPFWGMTKNPGFPLDYSAIPKEKGILMYHANFSNAFGHIDLWDINSCVYNCPAEDIQQSYRVSFWKF